MKRLNPIMQETIFFADKINIETETWTIKHTYIYMMHPLIHQGCMVMQYNCLHVTSFSSHGEPPFFIRWRVATQAVQKEDAPETEEGQLSLFTFSRPPKRAHSAGGGGTKASGRVQFGFPRWRNLIGRRESKEQSSGQLF